ncbi:helix-turn-helix transcriptional regulator [Oscillospiraceae bacterium 44-5]
MTLAEKILSLRTQRGMSQDDLAEKMEVSRQSVSKWETAQSTPDLDKIIRLADLFGVSVDELVRDGEAPQPPEPSQPQVVYVEREGKREGLTAVQIIGVILEVAGAALAILGIMGAPALVFAAVALVVLGLPLLLAKKHPFLIMGWLAVGLSCLALNPYTSVSPWGLIGGLRRLYYYITYITIPGFRDPSTVFAIAVGIVRGLLILALTFFTWRAWKKKKSLEKDG